MTTRVRIQHLDSNFPVEVRVMSKANSDGGQDVVSATYPIHTKGDEYDVYIWDGQYLVVTEIAAAPAEVSNHYVTGIFVEGTSGSANR